MTEEAESIEEHRWAAVRARDRAADGRFVTGVLSTGIYCRPSCPSRHPKRENVRFFTDGAAARAAGLRACLRCRPDDLARDVAAVAAAVTLIDTRDAPPALAEMAAAAGYAPHHFHRLFARATGVTPAAFARARRAERAKAALRTEARVTDAIYEAGFTGASAFYGEGDARLGMSPSAWAAGGRGATIRWAVAPTTLGPILVAATERGICRMVFGDDPALLAIDFPAATIEPGAAAMADLVARAVVAVERPGRPHDLPLDIAGTAFQEAVWQALAAIPPGGSLSYAALAAQAGCPGGSRAAGSACGANKVAVLIPCHRARRGDGSPGGYAWGLERKAALLAREARDGDGG